MEVKFFDRLRKLLNTISKNTFCDDPNLLLEKSMQCNEFYGFGRQFIRASIILMLLKTLDVDAFVETGTNTGWTSFLVAAQTKLPVFSCDINPEMIATAKQKLWPFGNRIHLYMDDSKNFLKSIILNKVIRCPFIYLDAHCDDEVAPLDHELKIILSSLDSFVVAIDDFKVPIVSGFQTGKFGDKTLEWDNIKHIFQQCNQRISVFYPFYPSSAETVPPCGWVLISSKAFIPKIREIFSEQILKTAHSF